MRKGFITDLWFVLAVWIAVVIVLVIFFISYLVFEFQGKQPLSYSVRFFDISTKPYLISGPLLHLRIDDRQFIEHAIESSFVGSLENSGSGNVVSGLTEYMSYLDLDYYDIELKHDNGDGTLERVFSLGTVERCGENDNGFCVLQYSSCGVGAVELEDVPEEYACPSDNYKCCVYDEELYAEEPDSYEIIKCGEYDMGVCNDRCYAHMIHLKEGDINCKGANSGDTEKCCAFKVPGVMTQMGTATYAEIPLFFRDRAGRLIVTVGEK